MNSTRFKPWMVSALLTCGTLAIHLLPGLNSMLRFRNEVFNKAELFISEDYLKYLMDVHRSEPAFARRPITTWLIDLVHGFSGISVGTSFILVQFTLLFACGVALHRLTRVWGASHLATTLSQVAFFSCFSVCFSFFAPIYTYDEPLQYCLLFIALRALCEKKWWLFSMSFLIAICARESSLLLWPSMFLFLSNGANDPRRWATAAGLKGLLAFVLPIIGFVLFELTVMNSLHLEAATQADVAGRFQFFEHNFGDAEMTWESLIYLYLVIGLPVYLLFTVLPGSPTKPLNIISLERSFLLALLLNTVVVLLCTKAREARLFALPLVFLWPLLGPQLSAHGKALLNLRAIAGMLQHWEYVLVLIFSLALIVLIVDHGWVLSDGNASGNLWHEYFLLQSTYLITHALSRRYERRTLSADTRL